MLKLNWRDISMFKNDPRNTFNLCNTFFAGKKLPLCLAQRWGPQFSNNLEDLSSFSCPTDELPCWAKFSHGPLWRLEQVEVTGALACAQGTDGWTARPKPRTSHSNYRTDDDISTSIHPQKHTLIPLKMRVYYRHTLTVIICITICYNPGRTKLKTTDFTGRLWNHLSKLFSLTTWKPPTMLQYFETWNM